MAISPSAFGGTVDLSSPFHNDRKQQDMDRSFKELQIIGNKAFILRPCAADEMPSGFEIPPKFPNREYGVAPSLLDKCSYVNLKTSANLVSPTCKSRVQIVNHLSNANNRGPATNSRLPKKFNANTPRSTASTAQPKGMVKISYANSKLSNGSVKKDCALSNDDDDDDLYQKPFFDPTISEDDEKYVKPPSIK